MRVMLGYGRVMMGLREGSDGLREGYDGVTGRVMHNSCFGQT